MHEEFLNRYIEQLCTQIRDIMQEQRYKPPIYQWDGTYEMKVLIHDITIPMIIDEHNFVPNFFIPVQQVRLHNRCIGCGYEFRNGDYFEFHKAGALCPDCSDFEIPDKRTMEGLKCSVCGNKLHNPNAFPREFPNKYKLCCGCHAVLESIIKNPENLRDIKHIYNPKIVEKLKLLAQKVI